jgi:hypothetical protein
MVGDDLLAGQALCEGFRMGPARIAEAILEVLVECGVAHDGSVADSHAVTHGDIEFELEADPNSESACLL